jgi:hypothetical protein
MDKLKQHIVPLTVMFGTASMGLYGLSQEIPHSGWLLAVGVLIGLFHEWN